MPVIAQAVAPQHQSLDENTIRETLERGLGGKFSGAKVLVLIPDHTRTIPLPMLFRMLVEVLADTSKLDFMVALGTHPALSEESLMRLVGISREERETTFRHIGLLNHEWDNPDALVEIGVLEKAQIQKIAGDLWHESLGGDTPIRINRAILDYDAMIILGPTFPHEVIGFSGGAKYLFPGISGAEMIHTTHWLGALATVRGTIGIKHTPVRKMVHAALECVPTPAMLVSMVVVGDGLAGIFMGDIIRTWEAAADLSSERHIHWLDKPFQRVLSHAPPMYDELWTAAKAMYKLDPGIADGGELILYAPHLDTISHVHGKYIEEAGYHVRDFYLKQWDKYGHLPLGVLAHGTHLRGSGTFENGVEKARINVTLSSKISAEDCRKLSLGYLNPDEVKVDEWKDREDEGILFVPKAGEMLYRLNSQRDRKGG